MPGPLPPRRPADLGGAVPMEPSFDNAERGAMESVVDTEYRAAIQPYVDRSPLSQLGLAVLDQKHGGDYAKAINKLGANDYGGSGTRGFFDHGSKEVAVKTADLNTKTGPDADFKTRVEGMQPSTTAHELQHLGVDTLLDDEAFMKTLAKRSPLMNELSMKIGRGNKEWVHRKIINPVQIASMIVQDGATEDFLKDQPFFSDDEIRMGYAIAGRDPTRQEFMPTARDHLHASMTQELNKDLSVLAKSYLHRKGVQPETIEASIDSGSRSKK